MAVLDLVLLVGVGFVGGVWNAMAGGATLFTFPALMAVGLSPVVANAMNFLGLLPSNAAALFAYKDELKKLGRKLVPLLSVSGLGALVGALLLVGSANETFLGLVPFLILVAVALFAFGDKARRAVLRLGNQQRVAGLTMAILFLASIYGGYFGAGLGIILLAIAQVIGYTNFDQANAIKNLLATSFTLLSIAVFGLGGIIDWSAAAIMMTSSTAGGYLGGRMAKRTNPDALRVSVILFGLVLAGSYFWRVFVTAAL